MGDEKKLFVGIRPCAEGAVCILDPRDASFGEIVAAEVEAWEDGGEGYITLLPMWMTQDEMDATPEFEGW